MKFTLSMIQMMGGKGDFPKGKVPPIKILRNASGFDGTSCRLGLKEAKDIIDDVGLGYPINVDLPSSVDVRAFRAEMQKAGLNADIATDNFKDRLLEIAVDALRVDDWKMARDIIAILEK